MLWYNKRDRQFLHVLVLVAHVVCTIFVRSTTTARDVLHNVTKGCPAPPPFIYHTNTKVNMAPHIIGTALNVVEIPGLTVRELAGNASTNQDTLSVAHEFISAPSAEPWKTNLFDEWLCVLKGKIEIKHGQDDEILTVNAGETCQVTKGERYRPMFPMADTEFLAICVPAFKPERCTREEKGSDSVSNQLENIHDGKKAADGFPEIIYHMCEKSLWESALAAGEAYFPPTFEKDGGFTHASMEAKSLITTANHFYQSSKDDWICIELNRMVLTKIGIVTKFEQAKPVGDIATAEHAKSVIYPHIFGGIPAFLPDVVTRTLPMTRDESGKFLAIQGL